MKTFVILLIFISTFLLSCKDNENYSKSISSEINQLENKVDISPSPKVNKNSQDIDQKVGIVDINRDENIICLRTSNSDLSKDTSIKLIASIYDPPQKILSVKIEKKLKSACTRFDTNPETTYFYSLKLTDGNIDDVDISFAIFDLEKSGKIKEGLASIDLDNDGKDEYFRHCASMEGSHLTIWTGKPLKGKRIWHYYYYLGYDTEPNCTGKDTED